MQRTERLTAFLEAIPSALIGVDGDLCVTAWNDAAEARFAKDRNIVLAHSLPYAVPELAAYAQTIKKAMTDQTVVRMSMASHPGNPGEEVIIAPLDSPADNGALIRIEAASRAAVMSSS